jgi:hypothetical protein
MRKESKGSEMTQQLREGAMAKLAVNQERSFNNQKWMVILSRLPVAKSDTVGGEANATELSPALIGKVQVTPAVTKQMATLDGFKLEDYFLDVAVGEGGSKQYSFLDHLDAFVLAFSSMMWWQAGGKQGDRVKQHVQKGVTAMEESVATIRQQLRRYPDTAAKRNSQLIEAGNRDLREYTMQVAGHARVMADSFREHESGDGSWVVVQQVEEADKAMNIGWKVPELNFLHTSMQVSDPVMGAIQLQLQQLAQHQPVAAPKQLPKKIATGFTVIKDADGKEICQRLTQFGVKSATNPNGCDGTGTRTDGTCGFSHNAKA